MQQSSYMQVPTFLCFSNLHKGWWKGMKQFFPAKSAEHEETPVRYSSSEIGHLRPRDVPTMLQTESAGTWGFLCLFLPVCRLRILNKYIEYFYTLYLFAACKIYITSVLS